MPPRHDALRRLIEQPLDYLHPRRLALPADMNTSAVRAALNPLLVDGLALSELPADVALDHSWLRLWVEHWLLLPKVAKLLGAYLQWGHLAVGGHSRQLNASQRRFAMCDLGQRHAVALAPGQALEQRIEAAGLSALLAWRARLPKALGERLVLMFSPEAEALQRPFPIHQPDPRLFILAVQHARLP
jgi:type III secretion system OrgA/MxiK family protein